MEATSYGHMFMDQEMEMLSESGMEKRKQTEDGNEKAGKKKRRSSFASKRRSICDILHDGMPGDLPNSGATVSSQSSSDSNSQSKLKPNFLNVRVQAVVADFDQHIKRYNQEYSDWKELLKNMEQDRKKSELLANDSPKLVSEDIPQELKDLALSEYVTEPIINFKQLRATTDDSLSGIKYSVEKGLKDLKLFKSVHNTIKCYQRCQQSTSNTNDNLDVISEMESDLLPSSPATTNTSNKSHLVDAVKSPFHIDTSLRSQVEWLMEN